MNVKNIYYKKLITADRAVKVVESGDWVDFGWCTTTPADLDRELAKRLTQLKNVNIRGGILLKTPEIFKIENPQEHFTWNSWHMGGIERKYISSGLAYYAPMRYSELPKYYKESIIKPKVAMFQVTPMDKYGYFNFGVSASHLRTVCDTSEIIIVEVNDNLPRCLGGFDENIHVSDVDMIVEASTNAVAELKSGAISEVDMKVAELIVEEISDGSCLQLGIGGMPNAVGSLIAKSDLKNLGVHTEMYVDAFVDISKAGKINGSQKNINRFRQTFSFAAGTQKLYEYLDNNPEVMSAPIDYTNDICVISAHDKFMSINNAVNVDLFGQISSESSGTRHISGAGGQLDFVLGAYLSKGGKSFICLSSTYTDKYGIRKSRILPTLDRGSIVTDTRANTHYIVTEFGKVNLKGLSLWQRCEAIISISHPDFHEELIKEAEKMNIWRRSNK